MSQYDISNSISPVCIIYLSFLLVKIIYAEKATKFCEISTIDFSYVVPVKLTAEILQNFVAFSEYMNFIITEDILCIIVAGPYSKK